MFQASARRLGGNLGGRMAALNKLTAVQIKAASIGDRLQDGGGLILDKTASGGR